MEQLVKIDIFGKHYTFKAETEVSQAKEIADFLVKEVGRVESSQPNFPTSFNQLGIMILTALNIASNNIEIQKNHSEFLREISVRSANLISKLDGCLM